MTREEEILTQERKTARSDRFADVMETLRQAESALPDYSSSYDGEIQKLFERIIERPAFRYDPGADPLYQSYRDQMAGEGSLAMRDTMGQAAALTGGYGSSYAQSAGQQQYGLYLQKLGAMMPELYRTALERYQAEGQELQNRLGAATGLADREYGRKKDRFTQAAALEKQDYDRMTKSYENLVSVISKSGYEPSDAELDRSSMSREEAEALRRDYLVKNPMAFMLEYGWPTGGTGGGGGWSGGGGGSESGAGDESEWVRGEKAQMLLDKNPPGTIPEEKRRRKKGS